MTFGQEYLTHFTGDTEYRYVTHRSGHVQRTEIVPIQFLKAVLPNPGDLGEITREKHRSVAVSAVSKMAKEQTYYVYNNCSHEAAYKETGAQGVKLYHRRSGDDRCQIIYAEVWKKPGVWNVERIQSPIRSGRVERTRTALA